MNDQIVARDFEAGETLWYKGVPFRVVNKATLEGPSGNWDFADAGCESSLQGEAAP